MIHHAAFTTTHAFEAAMFGSAMHERSWNLSHGLGFLETPRVLIEAARRALDEGKYKIYGDLDLDMLLRGIVRVFYTTMASSVRDTHEALVMQSASFAVHAALEAIARSEGRGALTVIFPGPNYYLLFEMAAQLGARVVCVSEPGDGIRLPSVRDIAAAVHSAAGPPVLLLAQPGNPNGLRYDEASLRAICGTLAEREGWLILDTVCVFPEHQVEDAGILRLMLCDPGVSMRTFVVDAMNKRRFCGAFRLASLLHPRRLTELLVDLQEVTLFYPAFIGLAPMLIEYLMQSVMRQRASQALSLRTWCAVVAGSVCEAVHDGHTTRLFEEHLGSLGDVEDCYREYRASIDRAAQSVARNRAYFTKSITRFGLELIGSSSAWTGAMRIPWLESTREIEWAVDLWKGSAVWLHPLVTFGIAQDDTRRAAYRVSFGLPETDYRQGVDMFAAALSRDRKHLCAQGSTREGG